MLSLFKMSLGEVDILATNTSTDIKVDGKTQYRTDLLYPNTQENILLEMKYNNFNAVSSISLVPASTVKFPDNLIMQEVSRV